MLAVLVSLTLVTSTLRVKPIFTKTVTTTSTTRYAHPLTRYNGHHSRTEITDEQHMEQSGQSNANVVKVEEQRNQDDYEETKSDEAEAQQPRQATLQESQRVDVVGRKRRMQRLQTVDEDSQEIDETIRNGLTADQRKYIRRGKAATVAGKLALKYGTKLAMNQGKKYGQRAGRSALRGSKKAGIAGGKLALKGSKKAGIAGGKLALRGSKKAGIAGGKLALKGSKKAGKAGLKAGKAALPKLLGAAKSAASRLGSRSDPCDC